VAEKSGGKRARNRHLRDFMLFTAPISCHAKSAYVYQSLRRGRGLHKAPKPSCPARFGPDRGAKYTPGASLAPHFGQVL
jgi:hypothetical protein